MEILLHEFNPEANYTLSTLTASDVIKSSSMAKVLSYNAFNVGNSAQKVGTILLLSYQALFHRPSRIVA